MLKLANQVIDAYDDVTHDDLKKLAKLNPRCHVMTAEEHAKLASDAFALSLITKKAHRLNKFPIDSADNTWLSNQFFELNHAKLPEEAAKLAAAHIKTACERFKIEPTRPVAMLAGMCKEASSNVYVEAMGDSVKTASVREVDLEKFAAARQIATNYTHAQFVMNTPAAVKVAAAYFEKNAQAMTPADRAGYAAAIQQRAGELGMGKQAGLVAKYASDRYSSLVDAHIRARVSLTEYTKPDAAQAFEKLGAAKAEMPPAMFARAMHALDKKAGLAQYYGGHIQDPFLATFAQEPDQYEGYRVKVAGREFTANELQSLAHAKYAKIKEYLGHSVADEFKREPVAIFDSLPMDVKQLMVGIADGTL